MGTREEAIAKAERQIAECGTDACFVNGAAYGEGFGHVERRGFVAHSASKAALCEGLPGYLGNAW